VCFLLEALLEEASSLSERAEPILLSVGEGSPMRGVMLLLSVVRAMSVASDECSLWRKRSSLHLELSLGGEAILWVEAAGGARWGVAQ